MRYFGLFSLGFSLVCVILAWNYNEFLYFGLALAFMVLFFVCAAINTCCNDREERNERARMEAKAKGKGFYRHEGVDGAFYKVVTPSKEP